MQIVAFGTGIMVLLLLSIVRDDPTATGAAPCRQTYPITSSSTSRRATATPLSGS